MAEKRKDSKGRVLRTGESERKDSLYQYRYTDAFGKRQTVYAPDLKELREKEKEINKSIDAGLNYAEGTITVYGLVQRYVALKQGVRYRTKVKYNTIMSVMEQDPFGRQIIKNIKMSDAKLWMINLQNAGKKYNTVLSIKSVVQPAFQMAVDEDILSKNPFDFRLRDVIANNSEARDALTPEEQEMWLQYIKSDKRHCKYYDEYVILLGTGLRVSEFCGLTLNDIDFDQRKINVTHQLVRNVEGQYYIEKPKSSSGTRSIPMTQQVYDSLQNICQNRKAPQVEPIIDGHTGFLFLTQRGTPKVAINIQNVIRNGLERYREANPDNPLPTITPHVLRHTFCTNMVNAGVDVKTVQYLMGHSNVGITLNVYAHASYDRAKEQISLMEKRQKASDCNGITA